MNIKTIVDFSQKIHKSIFKSLNNISGFGYVYWSFALYGAYIWGNEFIYTPLYGFWKHFIRPRRDIIKRYDTKWALVTGASDGIGKGLCYELAKSGVNIVLVGRSQEKL